MNQPDSSTAVSAPPTDNFYSPANFEFYARQPYEPLDRSSQTIRLLAVKKDESGQWQCTLRDSVPLAEADGTYTAISYCAGDPKKTRSLLVNRIQFNAFANLARAIEEAYSYRVREHGDTEAVLWTDQICIDQSNPAERSHQVGLMYKIYSGAREVTVCLSTDDHRGGSAIAWLKRLYQAVPERPSKANRWREVDLLYDLESNLQNEANRNAWFDLLDMLQQPWWSRAWVFQEYVAARKAAFLYGGDSIPDEMMIRSLQWLSNKSENILGFIKDYPVAKQYWSGTQSLELGDLSDRWREVWLSDRRRILDFVLSSHQESHLDFLQVLSHSRNCSASDKRDHIYAFIGLDSNSYGMDIDYGVNNSPETLFLNSAQRIIQKTGDLRILNFVDNSTTTHDLPSWVPDWSTRDSCNRFFNANGPVAQNISSRPFPSDTNFHFLENGTVLEVAGVYLDTVVGPSEYLGSGMVTKNKKFNIVATIADGVDRDDQLWMLPGVQALVALRPQSGSYRFLAIADWFVVDARWSQDGEDLASFVRTQIPKRIRLT